MARSESNRTGYYIAGGVAIAAAVAYYLYWQGSEATSKRGSPLRGPTQVASDEQLLDAALELECVQAIIAQLRLFASLPFGAIKGDDAKALFDQQIAATCVDGNALSARQAKLVWAYVKDELYG